MKTFGVGGRARQGFLSPIAKVLLPNNLRLLVNEEDDKDHFDEVAQTMELMVQALERGSTNIYDAKPAKIVNQAILEIRK
jgi:hypothetical protein